MTITAFYAALLALFFVFLSIRVIGWRRVKKVELGHGDDNQLLRRMRVHANFAE
ncbi:MAG: MAPEG family protein [Hyphomicrobium sp.]